MNWMEILKEFEEKIRSGQGAIVKRQLSELSLGSVPRAQYWLVANIAVRVGLPNIALKLMSREVKKGSLIESGLTVQELCEYAGALSAIGAYPEAKRILQSLNGNEFPKIFLYRAFAFFNEWLYADAIPELKKYIELVDSEYQKRVGKVNLCAAQVYTKDFESALACLETLETELSQAKQFFLLGNVLELKAQCFIGLGQIVQCEKELARADQLLSSTGSTFQIFVKKWLAVSSLIQGSKAGVGLLEEVRQSALSAQHYETTRECDLFLGVYGNQKDLLEKVYFGTPFSSYRQKILRSAQGFSSPSLEYNWKLEGPMGCESKLPFLIEAEKPIEFISKDSTVHNLQKILFSDFYSPWRVGTLFSRLFPDEHYNVTSSPNRIYQLIHRLNHAAISGGLGIRFESDGFGFRPVALANGEVKVKSEIMVANKIDSQIVVLKQKFGNRHFKSMEAREILGRCQSQVSEILAEAKKDGLEKVGTGRSTKYRFSS